MMKTLSMLLFTTILICLAVSCEEERSNCADDNSNGEYIEWSFNDETFVLDFDFVDVYYADDRILSIYPLSPEPLDGPFENFSIKYDVLKESADFQAASFNSENIFVSTYGGNLEMTVSSFSSEGDLICIQFDNGEFSGEIRVILDKIVKSGKVEGKVWLDENKNGINETDEDPLANVYIHLQTDSKSLEEGTHDVYPVYYPALYGIKTDDTGHFTLSGVFVNYPLQLSFVTREDNVTAADQGNDDTIDSDFNFTLQVDNRKVYKSPPFTLEQGETKDDFGLGITKE